jgi:hypothetical protein
MQSSIERFISYYRNEEKIILTAVIGLFVVIACALYWSALKETQATLNDEFLHREQVVARSGSQSVSGFINLLGKNVALIAEDFSEDMPLNDAQDNLSRFMDHWKDTPAATILLADENEKIIAQANRSGPPVTNIPISDKAYLIWSKTASKGDYFVGSPRVGVIGSAKGKYIINVASPVVVNGKFMGVVSVAVILSDLTDSYITPIKISENTRAFLFDENGIVLSSLASNLIGNNYFDFLSGYFYQGREDTINGLKSALISTANEGKLDINLPDSLNPGSFGEFLVAYSKVKVGDHNWLLAIKSPVSDSNIYIWKIKEVNFGIFVFSLLLVFLFAAAHLRADRLRDKERSLQKP